MSGLSLLDHFSALEDPRQRGKVLYPLREILLVVLCATMAGADDFVEIKRWGEHKIAFLRRFYPFKDGICSHDTLNDVINALPKDLFADCFREWVATLRKGDPDVIAIDGKTSRRAHGSGGKALHMVSAWAAQQRMVLGQEEAGAKENEITAIPRLLERLELRGAIVTIDAMGCQHGIAKAVMDRGGDYLFVLKANHPLLHAEAMAALDAVPAGQRQSCQTTDADHGRIETRTHTVLHDLSWMTSQRAYPSYHPFPGARMIGRIESSFETDGKTVTHVRHFISSLAMKPQELARVARAHWGIENRLHWVLDVVFHDDLMRLRTENGPANMAVVRHASLNIIRTIPDKASLKVRRKTIGWDDDYLEAALNRPAS
jgi:predicted transposase YbfD/YdcC